MKRFMNITTEVITYVVNVMIEFYAMTATVLFSIWAVGALIKDTAPVKVMHTYVEWHAEYGYWPHFACVPSTMDWICMVSAGLIAMAATIVVVKTLKGIDY